MRALILFSVSVLFLSCAPPEEDDPVRRANSPPNASLRAPVLGPLYDLIKLDASASYDPDGDPVTFVFQFNDGSESVESADPVVWHSFESQGIFTVTLIVLDIHNFASVAAQDVSIRDEYPEDPHFCDIANPCVVGDECEDGVCYSIGGAIDFCDDDSCLPIEEDVNEDPISEDPTDDPSFDEECTGDECPVPEDGSEEGSEE